MPNRTAPQMRARDTDRGIACAALDNAYSDGQLDFDEHKTRIDRANSAKTLGELRGLVSDLQAPVSLADPPPRPTRGNGRRNVLIGALVLALIGGLGAYLAIGSDDSAPAAKPPTTTTTTAPAPILPTDIVPIVAPKLDLMTAAGIRAFVDQYRERFGDTIADDVSLHPLQKFGSITRVDDRPERGRDYSYRGGFDPQAMPVSRDPATPVIDLAALNVDALAGLLATAPQQVGVVDAKVSYYSLDVDPTGPGYSVYANNEVNEGGYIRADLAGNVVAVHPFRR